MNGRALFLALSAAALLAVSICGLGLASLVVAPPTGPGSGPGNADAAVSDFARQDIPAAALAAYQAATRFCPGLSWTVLAAIGKVESDHGRSNLPGVHSGTNFAGAAGPMQFLLSTWSLPGIGAGDIYNLVDAAAAAARYLCSNGAGDPTRLRDAIWHYNHAWWYVNEVLDLAARYAAAPSAGRGLGQGQAGSPFIGCQPVVTQAYGPTSFPGEPVINGVRFHTGIDLACPLGTQVISRSQGTAHVYLSDVGFGNSVVVDSTFELPALPPAHYFVRYAHLLAPLVADGAAVTVGQVVGLEGSTGYSTGPHLHFEVDREQLGVCCSVSPLPLL